MLGKILEHHRGEVVQISHHQNSWDLVVAPCPKPWNPQFKCEDESKGPRLVPLDNEQKKENQVECGRSDHPKIQWAADKYPTSFGITNSSSMVYPGARFMPDWSNQTLLCVVPCRNSYAHHWADTLFVALLAICSRR